MKLKRIVILIIVGLASVLSATFFYINNDLNLSKMKKVDNNVSAPEPTDSAEVVKQDAGTGTGSSVDIDGLQEEASLDAVFSAEEPVDNFDDLVI